MANRGDRRDKPNKSLPATAGLRQLARRSFGRFSIFFCIAYTACKPPSRRGRAIELWAARFLTPKALNTVAFIEECSQGDPSAAAEPLEVVKDLDLLEASDEVDELADFLISEKAVPASEPRDAFHIAIAAVHGVNYLLTWNCKHIANATLRGGIERVCRDAGYEPPIICTPEELVEIDDDS